MSQEPNLKPQLLELALSDLNNKINTLQSEYKVYMDSAANETKSTAGDKHDTSRSMMQLEQEKLNGQLQQLKLQKKVLELIDPWTMHPKIQLGSVIITDQGNFFISISGKPIQIDSMIFNCISLQSPIGKAFHNSTAGKSVLFMNKHYTINSTY
jgi:transcription elongation GreA/GreB family factor